MNIEKIKDLWLPSDDAQIEQWRSKGVPFMQDKCLKSFLKYCESQNKKFKRVLDIGAWCGTWSIAMENFMVAKSRKWFCPWCGVSSYYDEGNIPMGGEVPPKKDN